MKVTPLALAALENAIRPLDTPERRDAYRAGDFPRSAAVKDLDKRYRWDLFWASNAHRLLDGAGYDDSHIDTALRRIVPALGGR